MSPLTGATAAYQRGAREGLAWEVVTFYVESLALGVEPGLALQYACWEWDC